MVSITVLALLAICLFYSFRTYQSFARNLAAAKASNIPYVIVPVYMINRFWLITQRLWVPYIRKLPASWIESWLDLVGDSYAWNSRYTPYKQLADTFITVSPGGNVLTTADASVISQITTRRNDFPKPIKIYGSLEIYGKNVVTTEGQDWRHHRKITSPPFAEKNNHMVWAESLHQAQAMMDYWMGKSDEKSGPIISVADDAMKLSLLVISRAGFGVRLSWSGAEGEAQRQTNDNGIQTNEGITSLDVGQGHSLSYTEALETLLRNMIWILLLPMSLLKRLPFKSVKIAYSAYIEWGKYMNEIYQAKKAQMAAGKEQEGMDLMGALVKGGGLPDEKDQTSAEALTEVEIMGNAFVFILAGHETTANAIHFSLILLATKIASQRHLQIDLDRIFQGRPIKEWDYDRDIPNLFGGMPGAVLNETLRIVPPVVIIPKSTPKTQAQPINIGGKKCVVPADCYINLNSVAVHRNPKYWPTGPPSDPAHPIHPTSNTDNDIEEFRPERWLQDTDSQRSKAEGDTSIRTTNQETETSDLGVNAVPDTSSSLFHPPKGAYIPFSEGYRACLGRRFAQVEVLTVLAVIFSQYSVELAVDKFATDEEVEGMNQAERKVVWEKAQRDVEGLMRDGMGTIFTLQMRGGKVPLRFVKRGKERFNWS